VDIPDQGQKIVVLVAEDGFVAVLKEMAGAAIAAVKIQGIPCEEFSHDRGEACFAALEKDVDVIVHKDPSVDCAFTFRNCLAEFFEEPGLVFVVSKDVRLVDPPHHDVVQGAGDV
jgi:hypothetical protein